MKALKQKYERLRQEHARMPTRLELFEETKVASGTAQKTGLGTGTCRAPGADALAGRVVNTLYV